MAQNSNNQVLGSSLMSKLLDQGPKKLNQDLSVCQGRSSERNQQNVRMPQPSAASQEQMLEDDHQRDTRQKRPVHQRTRSQTQFNELQESKPVAENPLSISKGLSQIKKQAPADPQVPRKEAKAAVVAIVKEAHVK